MSGSWLIPSGSKIKAAVDRALQPSRLAEHVRRPSPDRAHLVLPPPISTNALFANVPGKGRVTTKAYSAWKKLAVETLGAQEPLPAFSCPVNVTFFVGEVGVAQMDADNTAKAFMDALVTAGVLRDDKRKAVRSSCVTWVPGLRGCVAEIIPDKAPPAIETLLGLIPRGLRNLLK